MRKYNHIADQIIDGAGGNVNLTRITNSPTCLHLTVKDDNDEIINHLTGLTADGVASTSAYFDERSNTYQVILGEATKDVYNTIVGRLRRRILYPRGKHRITDFLIYVIRTIVYSMTPIVSLLAAGGVIAGLLNIMAKGNGMLNWLDPQSPTYVLFDTLAMAPFYFFPILVAFSAGRLLAPHDRAFRFASAAVGCFLVDPGHNPLTQAVLGNNALGQLIIIPAPEPTAHFLGITFNTSFFGIPLYMPNFAYTIIPMILCIIIMRPFSEWLHEHLPVSMKLIFHTVIIFIVENLLIFYLIVPVLTMFSALLSQGVQLLLALNAGLAGIVIGGLYQFLVVFGLQQSIQTIVSNNLASAGQSTLNMIICFTMIAQGVGALMVSIKSHITGVKGFTLLAAFSAFCGITEPALYGLNLRYQKVFLMSSVGAAVSAGFAGFTGLQMFGYNGSLTGFANFMKNPLTGMAPSGNFALFWVTVAICAAVTAFLVWRFGYDISITPKIIERERVIDEQLF